MFCVDGVSLVAAAERLLLQLYKRVGKMPRRE